MYTRIITSTLFFMYICKYVRVLVLFKLRSFGICKYNIIRSEIGCLQWFQNMLLMDVSNFYLNNLQ